MFGVKGLYGHIRRNHWRSLALFLGFLAAFEILAIGAWLPLRLLRGLADQFAVADAVRADPLPWFLIAGPIVGALWFLLYLGRHVEAARAAVGFDFADAADERRLRRLVEPLAISVGLPTPRLAVIESPAMNAFACGLTRRDGVIVVTRGLIDGLDDAELTGVLAHELAHLRNADSRLMAFAFAAQEAVQALGRRFAPSMSVRSWFVLVISPVHLLMMAALAISSLLGGLLAALSRILISRSREFIADADAVRLTKEPGALISALRKIEGRSALPDVPAAIEAMLIDGATTGALATHPTIAERIEALRVHAGAAAESGSSEAGRRTALASPSGAGARLASLGAIAASAIAAMRPASPAPAEAESQNALSRRTIRWAGLIVAGILVFNAASAMIGILMLPKGPDRATAKSPATPAAEGWNLRRN